MISYKVFEKHLLRIIVNHRLKQFNTGNPLSVYQTFSRRCPAIFERSLPKLEKVIFASVLFSNANDHLLSTKNLIYFSWT